MKSRVPQMSGILLFAALCFLIPGTASAACCSNYAVGSSCCNIFGCNCDGPCTNFGCSCPPVQVDGACGNCPGYDTCTPSGGGCTYCTDPLHCCDNDTMCCAQTAQTPPQNHTPATGARRSFTLPNATPMERFEAIDKDRNGAISMAEAKNWLKKSAADSGIREADLSAAFKEIDKNQNGTVEPAEFDSDLETETRK